MKRSFVKTADGSTSIYLEEMDEHYHSKHGAIAESEHIFIKNGLLAKNKEPISVFEVGMGTGLNVLTSLKAAVEKQLKLNYQTVEAFPIHEEEIRQINFPKLLNMEKSVLDEIHYSAWNTCIRLMENVSFIKYKNKLQEMEIPSKSIDVIYFDAFAPEKQAEMWTQTVFEKLYDSLKNEGVLVTYCVKGEIRRRLQGVGFEVEKLKGPPGGKREMCRAWKR